MSRESKLPSLPFGIGQTKPKHFRDMLGIAWENRDNLGYAWKVLSKGVCDGCALGVAGFHDWTIDGVHLCMTRLNLLRLNTVGQLDHKRLEDVESLRNLSNKQLRELGRLAFPMLREKGKPGFSRISWEEAYNRIASRIRKTDPTRLAFFLTSRGITNEVYYVAQKVARFLGTNSVDNAARICHSPSTAAMKAALGVAASTCSYKDWYGTDLIVFFGSNPANDQPVATKYLHEAKKLGTKVAFVNPYLEPGMKRYWVPSSLDSALFGTDIVDHWFPVNQGGDIAFLYATIKILIENGWVDQTFVAGNVNGFAALKAAVEELEMNQLVQQSGMNLKEIEVFAALIRDSKNAVFVWSMGITQHTCGADAVQMILNLGLLRGYVGRDKCGLMPIRGHSSVQGGAEMGAYATAFPGGKPISEESAKELADHYGFPVPKKPGLATTEMIEAAHRKQVDVLYCLGGNLLRNLPQPEYIADALGKVPMRIHQDIILTDQMFIPGEDEVILLPAKTRYEQEGGGVETTTERRVVFSPEMPRQVGEARTEWKILRDIAAQTLPEKAHLIGCETGEGVREEIARVIPFYDGIQNLKESGDSFQYGGPHLCSEGRFSTPDGKANLIAVELPDKLTGKSEYKLSTRRGKQFNSLVYAEIDPLNGAERESILINHEDAAEAKLMHGDSIWVRNGDRQMKGRVFLASIARGNIQAHWPEANVLIPSGIKDERGGVPDYNATVTIEKAE